MKRDLKMETERDKETITMKSMLNAARNGTMNDAEFGQSIAYLESLTFPPRVIVRELKVRRDIKNGVRSADGTLIGGGPDPLILDSV